MRIDDLLNEIITAAYNEARDKKHEYLTPEHILYASLFFDEGKKLIKSCGGNIELLKDDLNTYFNDNIPVVENSEPTQTEGIQNVLNTAAQHILSSGKDNIKLEHVIVAIYDEEEGFGSYFLKKQGIKRLDILNYITHGISKVEDEEEYELISEGEKKDGYDENGEVNGADKKENFISRFTVDLTEKARMGNIDPLIGREDILEKSIQILCRRFKNNPVHVGEPGVGKTAITEGLANLIAENKVPKALRGSTVYYLDMGSLLAGTRYRGDFEERIKKVLNKLRKQGNTIVYIDEIHNIVGAGSVSGGAMDASNILKPFLLDGRIKFIGATTYDEYKKIFEKDRALSRRFQKIEVLEPSVEETYNILLGLKDNYEKFHEVKYTDEALKSAAELSAKYINDRFLPDKAIDVIDEVGAYVKIHKVNEEDISIIDEDDIQKVVASIAKIPEQNVSTSEIDKLKNLEAILKKEIYSQDKAVETVVRAIKRSRAGFNDDNRTVANLLFVGPTGVGKTEISKKLAETLSIPLIRFDMSEYQEKHSVAKLIGAPPGYVGYEEGGLLTDAVRKTPHCVLLLDEIEKVHPDILNVLLQLMDYATLTDNTGKKADFRNVILIMTSNAGASKVGKSIIGFGERKLQGEEIKKEVERLFSPEFRNRLDDIVVFNGIDKTMALLIAKKALKEFEEKLLEKNINLQVTEDCYQWVAEKGYSSIYGAREILRVVQHEIKPYFVDAVLFGDLAKGGTAMIDVKDGKIIIDSDFSKEH
ncbi:ATP-dependent Clp protease ATP-binding subunit ClpA [Clostridium pasteurianum]|uniref:ATP-dependent Clp protease ATP-binding subunit clpA n=1 Tax=Clostridium pasteurianum BC1 TaxID=86416 RepID=R4K4B8_CLOPA|nr:ATP-dependent Clp protease ATP-binding subunit ClpA [Clostridium pasteurianum]AGK96531.1 ATP-dependent Clp protease ATP-binding subunit clpA [Clostridium pasteurianum BC1]